jgi:hypothetical protein
VIAHNRQRRSPNRKGPCSATRIVGRTRSDYRNSSRLGLAREPLTHSSRSPGRLRRPSTSLARSRASRRQMIRMLTRQVILALGSIAHPWIPPPRRAKRPGRGEPGGRRPGGCSQHPAGPGYWDGRVEPGQGDAALLHLLIRAPAEGAISYRLIQGCRDSVEFDCPEMGPTRRAAIGALRI